MTGIVVALPEELKTLTTKKIFKGQYSSLTENVLIAHAGAGEVNAARAAEQLIEQGVTKLLSWGCAGGLSPHLKPGDLVLADQLMDADGHIDTDFKVSLDWHAALIKNLSEGTLVYRGLLLEGKEVVSLSADKHKLHASTGAVAVDMESISIAKVAQKHKVPFIAIRVIVDPLSMDLPHAINQSMNAEGVVDMVKLLSFIARHPVEIPGLIRLGKHFNSATKTLKKLAAEITPLLAFNV